MAVSIEQIASDDLDLSQVFAQKVEYTTSQSVTCKLRRLVEFTVV